MATKFKLSSALARGMGTVLVAPILCSFWVIDKVGVTSLEGSVLCASVFVPLSTAAFIGILMLIGMSLGLPVALAIFGGFVFACMILGILQELGEARGKSNQQ